MQGFNNLFAEEFADATAKRAAQFNINHDMGSKERQNSFIQFITQGRQNQNRTSANKSEIQKGACMI